MERVIEFEWSLQSARAAARAFFWHGAKRAWVSRVAWLEIAVELFGFPDILLVFAVGLGVALFAVLSFPFSLLKGYAQALKRVTGFHALVGSSPVMVSLEEHGVTVQTSISTFTWKWTAVTGLLDVGKILALTCCGQRLLVLPARVVTDEQKAFLTAHVGAGRLR